MQHTEITSVNNDLVKETAKLQQKKYRDETKTFLLEGFKAIEEAHHANLDIERVFVLKERAQKYSFLSAPKILTTEPVLKKISTTDSAPDAVAIAKQKSYTIESIKNSKKILLLENIKDVGNLGTIIRSAKAFSQDAIILFGDTVDLYNPKCVRASVGNLWKLPIVHINDIETIQNKFESHQKIATLPKSDESVYLSEFKAKEPYIVMFGAESSGLSDKLINLATQKVTIEMSKDVESLNLSISAGIILYKFNH